MKKKKHRRRENLHDLVHSGNIQIAPEHRVSDRLQTNMEIMEILGVHFRLHPNTRFCQALYNLGIIMNDCDQFYEESEKTLITARSSQNRLERGKNARNNEESI